MKSRRETKPPAGAAVEDAGSDVYPGDHGLHASGRSCPRCERAIGAGDEVRRTASGDYVHLCC